MESTTGRQFLFIGTSTPEAAISKLKASGVYYRQKRLDSSPENWQKIIEMLEDPALTGVVAKLTSDTYGLIVAPPYCDVAPRLLHALAAKPHVLFVHEAVLVGGTTPQTDESSVEDDDVLSGETYMNYIVRNHWDEPDAETRAAVNELLKEVGLDLLPYRTNAELSVIASAFVDDNDRNLLFRVYVPSGRLYAAEADKLLTLFRDYLNQVGRHGIRQDGYSTAAGHVYEFFGNESLPTHTLTQQFDDFAHFLEKCIEDPGEAEKSLLHFGMDRLTVPRLVQRYGKEARRLHVDLRQEREARMLALRHRFESELLDSVEADETARHIGRLIEALTPQSPGFSAQALLVPSIPATPVTININQQVVHAAEGTVVHNIQGTAHFGAEAKELLALIGRHAGQESTVLESAVHELEDPDARPTDRLGAKQRIRAFLFRIAENVEGSALDVLQKYVEAKMGL